MVSLSIIFIIYLVISEYYGSSSDEKMLLMEGSGSSADKQEVNDIFSHLEEPKQSEISQQNCPILKDIELEISILKKESEENKVEYYKELENHEKDSHEKIVSASKFSIYDYRLQKSDLPKEYSALRAINGVIDIPDMSTSAKLTFLLLGKNYEGIIELINEKQVNSNTIVNGRSLISSIMISNVDVGLEFIYEIVNSDIEVNFSDLVNATLLGVDVGILRYLDENYYDDVTKVWENGFRRENLLMAAVGSSNIEAFFYWYNRGISSKPIEGDYGALDVLPNPKTTRQKKINSTIFEFLVSEGELPFDFFSLNSLDGKLDKNTLIANKNYIEMSRSFFNQNYEHNNLKINSKEEEIQNSLRLKFDILENCYGPSTEKSDYVNPVPNNTLIQLLEIKSIYEVADYVDLEQKKDDDIVLFLNSTDWDTNLEYFSNSSYSDDNHIFAEVYIINMINNGAPSDKIISAINAGISINEKSIFAIINSNRGALIDKLIPYGLDVYSTNSNSLNSLDYAIKMNRENIVDKLTAYF